MKAMNLPLRNARGECFAVPSAGKWPVLGIDPDESKRQMLTGGAVSSICLVE